MLLSEKNDTHLKGKRIDATEMPNIMARSCKMSAQGRCPASGEKGRSKISYRTDQDAQTMERSLDEDGGGVARRGRWREALSAKANRIQEVRRRYLREMRNHGRETRGHMKERKLKARWTW